MEDSDEYHGESQKQEHASEVIKKLLSGDRLRVVRNVEGAIHRIIADDIAAETLNTELGIGIGGVRSMDKILDDYSYDYTEYPHAVCINMTGDGPKGLIQALGSVENFNLIFEYAYSMPKALSKNKQR